MRVGKDWLGEARRREEVAPRPDVLRFLSSSAEARALRGSYASKVSEELSFVSGTKLDWEVLADVMKKSAFAVVGPTPRRHKKPWLQGKESEIRVLESEVHRVSELLRRAKGCGSGEVPFLADARREASKRLRAAKRRWEYRWWADLAAKANMARDGGDEYVLWRICKQLWLRDSDKSHMGCPRTCANIDREREAWKQFLSDIQTGTGSVNDSVWDLIPEADSVVEGLGPLPSRSEFDEALRKMNFGKRGVAMMLRWSWCSSGVKIFKMQCSRWF